jgi:undecaprenyl-diphosphatase
MLIIAGTVLFLADKFSTKKRGLETVTLKDSLVVGTSQAIALIPGVSRSGSTLTAGLLMGLKREDAARFSFLMSLPITLGAIAVQGKDVLRNPELLNASPLSMLLGILISGASGFWAIGFLLNYLKSKDVTPFFVWRVLAGLAVFVIFHFRHS